MVVGLANPGAEFAGTRHNVGGDVVHLLSDRHGSGRLRGEKGQMAAIEEVTIGGRRVALAVPTTYMNDSGRRCGRCCAGSAWTTRHDWSWSTTSWTCRPAGSG